ncbi:MAG: DUF2191 domain-containing protein [Candidatus Eremiobacteraeota bacterium]|nr:DUF2191 domain-containing protein [Candidatus Eremiobacteraeota bacterium]
MDKARAEALRRGTTLTALIEEGLTVVLAGTPDPIELIQLPVCSAGGGTLPGVDINNNSRLLDVLERE